MGEKFYNKPTTSPHLIRLSAKLPAFGLNHGRQWKVKMIL